MERRRRIRDMTHRGQRWIASVVADEASDGTWRGRLVFFLDESEEDERQAEDNLEIQSLSFDGIVAQATALSPDEVDGRLGRALGEMS